MSYFIIFFVLALALAPIMAFKPSKKQKRQTRMRDRARALGLQVQLCPLPQTHRQKVRQEDTTMGVIYRLLWCHPDGKLVQFDYLLNRLETEHSAMPSDIQTRLQSTLSQLSDSLLAIEFNNVGVAVYWQEEGDEDTVAHIAKQLESLKTSLQQVSLS